MNKKYFTPEEANQLLPYVREEISFLQGLKSQFQDAYREREQMKKSQSATEDDLFTLECKLEFMEMEAQMRLQHLTASGIQVKDIDVGLVDFPALLNGEEVLLCWREGEEAVEHYHGLYDGFIGRKKLD
ncbi:MAG TPA: DUF2203 domain-containing protein [Brevibacillus sp.]|nr:DUF2203 domain-containing protein [Brevibacillus sp.]